MGISIRKALIISLGVLSFGILPNGVDAAEYAFGKATKTDNVTKIPIAIKIEDGETVTTARLGCYTKHTEVDCAIEPISGTLFQSVEDASGYVFAHVDINFPVGESQLAYMVLTNNSSSKNSNLEVGLDKSSIENVDQTLNTFTEVGAKPAQKPKSSVATLKDIKFSQGTLSPEFNADVTEYTVYKIADTINSVRITPTCSEGDCDFSLSGGKSINGMTVTLNQGENEVKVEVTSEDGQNSLTYTFTVYRGETAFNSAKLSSLSFGDYTLTPAFSTDTKSYSITVPNTVNNLVNVIKYETEDENAKVDVSGLENFVVGTNTIKLTIDNASGDETITYTVSVNRLSEENIEILSYKNNEITFKDADGIQTTLSEDSFKTQYPTEYQRIQNNEYKFDEDGNIITEVEETPKDEIDEEKENEKSDNKVWLIVLLIVVGLIVIVVSGILIFKKKKTKDEEQEEQKPEENTEDAVIDEEGIEESIIGNDFSKEQDATVDIDEALSDLMNTKQYEFKDEE